MLLLAVYTLMGRLKRFLLCGAAILSIRIFLGGVHMKTYTGCLLFSWCYFFIAIYIAPLIDGNLCVYAACLILCVLNILLFAPIPSANRIMPSGISKRQKK